MDFPRRHAKYSTVSASISHATTMKRLHRQALPPSGRRRHPLLCDRGPSDSRRLIPSRCDNSRHRWSSAVSVDDLEKILPRRSASTVYCAVWSDSPTNADNSNFHHKNLTKMKIIKKIAAAAIAVTAMTSLSSCNYNSLVENSREWTSPGRRWRTSTSAVPT